MGDGKEKENYRHLAYLHLTEADAEFRRPDSNLN